MPAATLSTPVASAVTPPRPAFWWPVRLGSLLACAVPAALGCGDPPGGGETATPITERALPGGRPAYTCRVGRDRADHSPRQWPGRQALVTTSGGTTFMARLEAMAPDPSNPLFPGVPRLVVSTFAADGSFGPSINVSTAAPETLGGLAVAPVGGGFALVWVEGATLKLSTFGGQGARLTDPRTVTLPGMGRDADPRLAIGADGGLGVIYEVPTDNQPTELRLAVLDPGGAVRGTPRRLGTAPAAYADPAPTIVAAPDGYAVIWRGASSTGGRIQFARADLQGAENLAPRPVSPPVAAGVMVGGTAGFEPTTTALLPVEGGFLAAWTETRFSPSEMSNAWAIVRVARLSPDGVVQGAAPALRAAAADVDEVEPSLVRFGDAVAVLWGRGSHIYICGGCIPDHRIDLLLIDPRTLDPLSNVVSLTNGGGARDGGLLRRAVTASGSSLLTSFELTFHVHATPGSATFVCDDNR
jgi:hypothetical protein